jgi:hypothetical protein
MACLRLGIPYVGLCFNAAHKAALWQRLNICALSAAADEGDSLYDCNLAAGLRGPKERRNHKRAHEDANPEPNPGGKPHAKAKSKAAAAAAAAAAATAAGAGGSDGTEENPFTDEEEADHDMNGAAET